MSKKQANNVEKNRKAIISCCCRY